MKIKIIQNLIDKLRGKLPPNNHIKSLGRKILSYEKNKDSIDTIILGSSHAQLGYRAEENEFNFGLSFQDLYYSYELYKKIGNPKLKNIILFYSVFSPGDQTIKTRFYDKCVVYKVITGIDYQDRKIAKNKKLYSMESSYKKQFKEFQKKFYIDASYRGNEKSYTTCFKPPLAKDRAQQHYKHNIRHNNQTDYVGKIQNLANKNGAHLLVILSPATKSYRESLPCTDELFEELFKLSQANSINILNMYDTDIFEDSDFEDWDHLNIKGAEKLTSEIKKYLKELTK